MNELSLSTKDSFDDVLKLYGNMVYRLAFSRVANSFDADDITQSVFLKYLRADKVYNDEEHRKAWLIKTTINTSKTLVLSSWSRRRTDLSDETVGSGEDKNLLRLESESTLYSVVASLPQKYRDVIHLFYYEDMSLEMIAQATGKNINTIKSHLHRARNILKERLEGVEF